MTTDAPRPDDAPQSDAPQDQSQSAPVQQSVPDSPAEPQLAEPQLVEPHSIEPHSIEPESSKAPEPPETPDEPENSAGETLPAEPTAPAPVASTASEPSSQQPPAAGAKIKMQGAQDASAVPSTGDTTPEPSKVKVEIPKDEDLDAGLEAELEAALSGQSTAAESSAGEASAAGEESASSDVALGQRLKGTISSITADSIIVDMGVRTAGIVPARQFAKMQPEVGQQIEVVVDSINEEEGTAACSLPGGARKPAGNWDGVAVGQVVDALVKKTNKGGLEVMVGGLRGFMPASQVDLGFVSDLEQFVGQKLTSRITEVNPQRRKLVVSRRSLIAEERKEKEGELFDNLEKGKTVTGKVKSIKDFGAFVDLGGADGLLHIGQISWSRINHPSDALEVGQEVEVQILEVDTEKKKISLSMRQLQANPWSLAEQNYPVGSPVSGTVSRVTDFGAFVKLEPGVEGLIHISQLDHKRVRAVSDVLREGQDIEAKVLEVDTGKRRISLSLKAMTAAPEPEMNMDMGDSGGGERDDRRRRRPRGDLRGGRGGSGGAGLFGDPNDFR